LLFVLSVAVVAMRTWTEQKYIYIYIVLSILC